MLDRILLNDVVSDHFGEKNYYSFFLQIFCKYQRTGGYAHFRCNIHETKRTLDNQFLYIKTMFCVISLTVPAVHASLICHGRKED